MTEMVLQISAERMGCKHNQDNWEYICVPGEMYKIFIAALSWEATQLFVKVEFINKLCHIHIMGFNDTN